MSGERNSSVEKLAVPRLSSDAFSDSRLQQHPCCWEGESNEMDYGPASQYMMPPPTSHLASGSAQNISSAIWNGGEAHQHGLLPHCPEYQDALPLVDSSSCSQLTSNGRVKLLGELMDESRETKRTSSNVGVGSGEELASPDSYLKRPRLESAANVPFKVRKERLGERITALQQLVSPFGKTDTASVLLEAIGYIKFLQEQVQVLSTPYMKSNVGVGIHHDSSFSSLDVGKISWTGGKLKNDDARHDLRSRGLCLVPVSCTLQVANDNGADYWTPAIGGNCR